MPLLFVPPEINRYYVLDLAPGRSLVEFAISQGMQTFMLVWRNPSTDPSAGHGYWGMDEYLAAHVRVFDVVREITGADDLNVAGLCAGGMTSALAQAHLAAVGGNPVYSATYLVTMLDARQPNMVTTLATPQLSVGLAAKLTLAEQAPASLFTMMLAGQLATGGSLSLTVTVKLQVEELP